MNKKVIFIFRCIVVAWIFSIAVDSSFKLTFPQEPTETEVCIDFDEVLNYCNESKIEIEEDRPYWMSIAYIFGAIFLIIFYVPILKKEYRELRYGARSTWDDEFKKGV